MNKKIFAGAFASAVFGGLILNSPVMANEGTVLLKGAGTSGACFASSIYVDGTYRVLATCRDLKVALTPEENHYVMWLTTEKDKPKRLGEIENGKMSTSTDQKFTGLFVTAEEDAYAYKPSDNILISGALKPIDFGSDTVSGVNPSVTTAPTPTQKKSVTATPTEKITEEQTKTSTNQGIGSALSTVLKIALFGFGTLLLIVGVFSFISRKRSL